MQLQKEQIKNLLRNPDYKHFETWMDIQVQTLVEKLVGSTEDPRDLRTMIQTIKLIRNKPYEVIKESYAEI